MKSIPALSLLSEPADCLCSRLDLKLSPARMEVLLNALRNEAQQVTELGLKAVDRLIYHNLSLPTKADLHAFQTECEQFSDLFSDVVQKIGTEAGLIAPPTLSSILKAETLSRLQQGALPPRSDAVRLISRGQYPLLSLGGWRSYGLTPLPNTPWALVRVDYAPPFSERTVRPGHVCSLILLPENDDVQERLADLLAQRRVRSLIRRICEVGPSGYLKAMTESGVGYHVDLFAMSLATGLTLEELLDQFPRGYLVWTTKKDASRLAQQLSYIDCNMTPFMRATRRPALSFSYRHEPVFACSFSVLRQVMPPSAIELRLTNTPIDQQPTQEIPVIPLSDYLVTYITLAPTRSHAPDALNAWVSQAQKALQEQGANTNKCYLATGLCEHPSASTPSLWSAALSLHAAQCAHSLSAIDVQICESDVNLAGLTVCLIAPLGKEPHEKNK